MKPETELDLTDLRVVLTVAETTSYTRAAQKLGITQPAISRRVTALEQSLHTRLFRREGRLFLPTEAGAAFCERAAEVLELMERLPQSARESSSNPTGDLALGLPPTTGEMLVSTLVPAYRQAYPDVFLRIEQGYVNDLFDMLMDKRVDVAMLNGPFSPASVDLEPLFDHHLGIVYPTAWKDDSPLGGPMPESLTLAQVARLPLIVQSSNQAMRHLVDGAFRAAGLKPKIVMEVNSFILQRSLVQPQVGCIFMSNAIKTQGNSSQLEFAPIADASLVYTMYVATRRVGQPTLATKLMVKMIKQHMHGVTERLFPHDED
jgi:LysR family nitrogen assimilation transcriptional regulator